MISSVNSEARDRWLPALIGLSLTACVSGPINQDPSPSPLPYAAGEITPNPGIERSRAIAAYRDYLERFPNSKEYSEVSRRLADLLLEEGLNAELAVFMSPSDAARAELEAERAYLEAAARYEELLFEAPNDQELLYQLSRAYEESGQSEKALGAISRLLAEPASQQQVLWSDTVFRQAELQFSLAQYPEASVSYASVIRLGPDIPTYRQSLYKLGWSQVKQEQYLDALSTFFLFIDTQLSSVHTYDQQLSQFTLADRQQLEEVMAGMGQCFGLTGGLERLKEMVTARQPVVYEVQLYQALAGWYERRERYTEAAETWLALVNLDPHAEQGPDFAISAIQVYQRAGFEAASLEAQRLFVELYGPGSQFWETRDPSEYRIAKEELKLDLVALANHEHGQFRSTGDRNHASNAETYYRNFLAWFNRWEDASQVRFQLAELLSETNRAEEAYAQYTVVAWSSDDEILAPEAAIAGIRLIETMIEQTSEVDATLWEKRAYGDSVRFVEYFPTHETAPVILARSGGHRLRGGEVEAVDKWVENLLAGPAATSDELGQVAFSLKAQAASLRGEHGSAALAYRDALRLAKPDDGRRHTLLLGQAQAFFARGQESAKAGEWGAAMNDFKEAARLSPETSLRAAAEFDLAAAHLSLERWEEAVRLLESHTIAYPEHELQPEVQRKLAFAYSRQGSLVLAADRYFDVGRSTNLQPALRREALANALRLYQLEGHLPRAIHAGEYYVDVFPLPAWQAIPVMRQLAELESLLDNEPRGREWLARIVSLDREAGDSMTVPVAAEASLELADYRRKKFNEIRLEIPLKSNLSRKISSMEKALSAYESAIDYGIPTVTSAAMYRMASMYDDLGRALLGSERPASLTEHELLEYESLLAAQAAPFAQQAMDIYRLNAQRAKDQPADPWVAKSREQLQVLTHASENHGASET
jgi:tetratricopeptide (TPR) repeat protein